MKPTFYCVKYSPIIISGKRNMGQYGIMTGVNEREKVEKIGRTKEMKSLGSGKKRSINIKETEVERSSRRDGRQFPLNEIIWQVDNNSNV